MTIRQGDVDWLTMAEHDRMWKASETIEPVVWYASLAAGAFAAAGLLTVAFCALAVAAVTLITGRVLAWLAIDRNRPVIDRH